MKKHPKHPKCRQPLGLKVGASKHPKCAKYSIFFSNSKEYLKYPKSGYKYGCDEEFAIIIHEKSKNKNIISADVENILIILNILNIPMGKQGGVENVVSPNLARSVIRIIGKILKPHAENILSIPNVQNLARFFSQKHPKYPKYVILFGAYHLTYCKYPLLV